jgi:ribosomal-protein-alanine N-acetyltransferase
MRFVPLALEHAGALLAFEEANRAWFESFIDARAPEFYSEEGVRQHILGLLYSARAGSASPWLILDEEGAVIGRANLKDVNRTTASAEIGYRIAQSSGGRGVATQAVRHLLQVARGLGLRKVEALVSETNPASARVLQKNGFVQSEKESQVLVRSTGGTARVRCYELALDQEPSST